MTNGMLTLPFHYRYYRRNRDNKQGFTFAPKFSNILENRVTAKCNAVITVHALRKQQDLFVVFQQQVRIQRHYDEVYLYQKQR